MSKIKFLSTLILTYFMLFSFGQDFDLIWSSLNDKQSKKERLGQVDYMMSEDGYHYFVIFNGTRKKPVYSLFKLDDKMNVVSASPINFKIYGKNELAYNGSVALNGKMFVRTSYFNNSQDINYGFISELSKDGVLSSDLTELDAMKMEKKRSYGYFSFDVSEDQSKVMVSRITPFVNKEQENYALKVLDADLKEIWSEEVRLPYSDRKFSIWDYNVDNDGNAYLGGRLYEGKNDTKTSSDDYAYKIFMHNSVSGEMKEYTVEIGDVYPTDMVFKFNDENLLVTGLYSDKETRSDAGVFHLEIDKVSSSVISLAKKDFDQELKDEYRSEKQIKKDKKSDKGVPDYEVREVFLTDSDERIMVAEQYDYYTTTHTYTTSNGNGGTSTRTVTTHHYVYGDILVTKFNKSGEVLWLTKIEKRQHTTNDGGYLSSYVSKLYDNGNKIEFFYAEMKSRKEAGTKKVDERFVTKSVTVDAEGNQSEKPLFSIADEETIFRAKASVELDDKRTLILGERKMDFKFGLIEFK
ncbi:MAG: hypothetical protein ACI9O4_002204 [Chitinophagales bacterium]|jgi:hypothetical protein